MPICIEMPTIFFLHISSYQPTSLLRVYSNPHSLTGLEWTLQEKNQILSPGNCSLEHEGRVNICREPVTSALG